LLLFICRIDQQDRVNSSTVSLASEVFEFLSVEINLVKEHEYRSEDRLIYNTSRPTQFLTDKLHSKKNVPHRICKDFALAVNTLKK
jgi:hypothetical protein